MWVKTEGKRKEKRNEKRKSKEKGDYQKRERLKRIEIEKTLGGIKGSGEV